MLLVLFVSLMSFSFLFYNEEERSQVSSHSDLFESKPVHQVLDGMQIRKVYLLSLHVPALFVFVSVFDKQLVNVRHYRFLIQ